MEGKAERHPADRSKTRHATHCVQRATRHPCFRDKLVLPWRKVRGAPRGTFSLLRVRLRMRERDARAIAVSRRLRFDAGPTKIQIFRIELALGPS